MGELHLQIYVERIKREYGVDCDVGEPRVNYRESITRKVDLLTRRLGEDISPFALHIFPLTPRGGRQGLRPLWSFLLLALPLHNQLARWR